MLLNYDKFVEGITEIGLVEDDLQVQQQSLIPLHKLAKLLPEFLSAARKKLCLHLPACVQAAYAGTKAARELLALVKSDVQINIKVAKQTKRKHAYVRLLEVLLKLQQTYSLHTALK